METREWSQSEMEGYDQAVRESRKRIKKAGDYWNRLYQQFTGDCDVRDEVGSNETY